MKLIGAPPDRHTATTLITASRSNRASFPTQDPVGTSTNSKGENSHKNVIPAAVGGSLGALAIIVLVIIYIFLRRRRRRRSVQRQIEKKSGGFSQNSQDQLHTTEPAQNSQRESSRTTPVAAKTRAIGTTTARSPPNETSARAQIQNPNNQQEIRNSPTQTAMVNPFADPPANHGTAITYSAFRVEDSHSECSNPFNLDRDFDDSPARPEPGRNVSNDSRYSRDLDSRSTNSTFSGHRESLRRTNSSQWRADRGMSTYSDPFDLERPLTIDSTSTQKMDGLRRP